MKPITFYDFDLQLPAAKRWGPIFDTHIDYLPNLQNSLRNILNQFGLLPSFIKPIYNMTSENNILYYDEICYIAERIGFSSFEALLMQLIYETSSACTATVLKVGTKNFFFRTMDWPMMFLKDITIGLNIKRGSKLLGKVTTWLGYVGFLTATNTIDNYTITINYRRTKDITLTSIASNLYRTVRMYWPIGYLVRHIIENSFNIIDAKNSLETAPLISPCYATIYVPDHQSYIITRDCDKLVDTRTENLIQTNCDWNKTEPNILWSLERINMINKIQKNIDAVNGDLTSNEILTLLLKHPVLNEETVYFHYQYGDEFETIV
ncbi:acid ceramidase-like protein [Tupanvirus soda lake]|uniref:Acid ceramidase-like protein n=2 Tax=Tupanvirus TaxID=2094720 RepID=A0A6N1P000_9VIRU|nr:acid ceramidase-like protein [Tupanvirus soda lake]QKU34671.1 acid ceramidase-like protein [Tupanvirus soda lake]